MILNIDKLSLMFDRVWFKNKDLLQIEIIHNNRLVDTVMVDYNKYDFPLGYYNVYEVKKENKHIYKDIMEYINNNYVLEKQ